MSVYKTINSLATVTAPPALTAKSALQMARELGEPIASRARESECLRRCPDKTIQELQTSGLLRMMQPRRFGGSELGMTECLDVTLELAKACPSTAWVFTNLASHAWTIGQLEHRTTRRTRPARCLGLRPLGSGGYGSGLSLWQSHPCVKWLQTLWPVAVCKRY